MTMGGDGPAPAPLSGCWAILRGMAGLAGGLPSVRWSQLVQLGRNETWECLGSKVSGKGYSSPPAHPHQPPLPNPSMHPRETPQPDSHSAVGGSRCLFSPPHSQPQPLQPSAVLYLPGHQPDGLHRLRHRQHDGYPRIRHGPGKHLLPPTSSGLLPGTLGITRTSTPQNQLLRAQKSANCRMGRGEWQRCHRRF